MSIEQKRKIRINNNYYNIIVDTYPNNRICLKCKNKKSEHELTINLKDTFIDDGHVFLDPKTKTNGILKVLKKKRIIREICGTLNYQYVDIPIAILNMGILRKYDNDGVNKHLLKITGGDFN